MSKNIVPMLDVTMRRQIHGGICVIFSLLMLFVRHSYAQSVEEHQWIKINSHFNSDTYLDNKSIVMKNNGVSAWLKYDLHQPVLQNFENDVPGKYSKVTAFYAYKKFDCKKNKNSINKVRLYSDVGDFIEVDWARKNYPDKKLIAAIGLQSEETKRICNFSKKGTIDKKGWEFVAFERYRQYKDGLDDRRSAMRSELQEGAYGEDGLASPKGLERLNSIVEVENEIENLSKSNIYALEYTALRYLAICNSQLKNNSENFSNINDCEKAKSYLSGLSDKGRATYQMAFMMINVLYFKEVVNYEKYLGALLVIEKSNMEQVDRENLQQLMVLVKANLTKKQISLIEKSIKNKKK